VGPTRILFPAPLEIHPDRPKDEGLLAQEDEANLPAERWINQNFRKRKLRTLKASPVQQKEFAGFCETKPTG